MQVANTGFQRVINWQGIQFGLNKAITYLGVWLDTKLTFAEHINKTPEKAEKTSSALICLMSNIVGPRSSKRKLLASVVHGQVLLYMAPLLCYLEQETNAAVNNDLEKTLH